MFEIVIYSSISFCVIGLFSLIAYYMHKAFSKDNFIIEDKDKIVTQLPYKK